MSDLDAGYARTRRVWVMAKERRIKCDPWAFGRLCAILNGKETPSPDEVLKAAHRPPVRLLIDYTNRASSISITDVLTVMALWQEAE